MEITTPPFLDTSYLRYPRHQTVQVLPKGWDKVYQQVKQQLVDFLGVPFFDQDYIGYSDIEIQKIKRTYDWMISPIDPEQLKKQRYNFRKIF